MKLFHRTSSWIGGMHSLNDPKAIPPDAVAEIRNGVLDLSGFVRTRDGCEDLGAPGDNKTSALGLIPYYMPDGETGLLSLHTDGIYRNFGGATWDLVDVTNFSLVDALHAGTVGRNAAGTWLVYLFSVGRASGSSVPYSGLAWVRPNGTYDQASQRSDIAPGTALWWQGRLWIADVASYPSDTLFWSHIWDGGDFSGFESRGLRVDPQQGGRITALVPTRGTAPQLYIFKENAIYLLNVVWGTGQLIPGGSDDIDTTAAAIKPLNYRVGCVAPRSAVWVPSSSGGDAFFLAADGVRSLRRTLEDVPQGGGGLPISTVIKDWVDRITWAHARNAVAAVHENKYYLAVPLDGSVVPSHVFVKDLHAPLDQGWAVWDLAARSIVASDEARSRLYFQTCSAVSGGVRVFEIASTAPNEDPGGSPIEFTIQTREYTLGDKMSGVRKLWRWVELHYDVDESGATVVCSARIDGQDNYWTLPPFFAEYVISNVILPAPLPWYFGSGFIQTRKIGLEGVPPGFGLQLRFSTSGPGVFRLRRVEVVAQPVSKEWE